MGGRSAISADDVSEGFPDKTGWHYEPYSRHGPALPSPALNLTNAPTVPVVPPSGHNHVRSGRRNHLSEAAQRSSGRAKRPADPDHFRQPSPRLRHPDAAH